MIALAHLSRSRLILAAALALALDWFFSMGWWWTTAADGQVWGIAVKDAFLAAFFWMLARRRWFPVPLFYAHAILLLYYVVVSAFGFKIWFWISASVNRLFDLELLYVAGCAVHRIRAMRRREERARW